MKRLLLWLVRRWNRLEYRQADPPKPHEHRWRSITEFARQCDDRECAVLEVVPGAPDYMRAYLLAMTTKQARKSPIGEAEIAAHMDPRMDPDAGRICPFCVRVIPPAPVRIELSGDACPFCAANLASNKGDPA